LLLAIHQKAETILIVVTHRKELAARFPQRFELTEPASRTALMQTTQLIKRSLAYYWQTNLVVVLGVAIAVSVLAGALLIGESVRGSLRDLSARRLGKTDDLISAPNFFREQLAADLEGCPLIVLDGVVGPGVEVSVVRAE
jgi:hypothetical protein